MMFQRSISRLQIMDVLPQVHHACFQGRGSGLLLQMRHECFGWRPVSKALSGLVVEDASDLVQGCLRHLAEVGVRRQKAADALVGIFDGAFLPGRAWITEPASCTDTIFQSPECRELCATIKREALTCEGGQAGECPHDLVHDWSGMPARVFDQYRVAALALDEGRDIGMAKRSLEDDKVTLPMSKLRSVSNEIRPLRYAMAGRKCTVARLS